MNILADGSLPGLREAFPTPFKITQYTHNKEVSALLPKHDILLCRASLKVNQTLLQSNSLRYVATASSGSDNLDHIFLQSQGIVSIDAKGCNAKSVADYIMSCLAYLDKQYAIENKKIGIIGLGHVGTIVYKRLKALGFELLTFDPLKALQETNFKSCKQEELYNCDLLCVHAELHHRNCHPSNNLINHDFLSQLKPGCIIINAARGGIIDENALLKALPNLVYCTDVYLNEPHINQEIIKQALLCTPHIAGHSIEAKYTAVSMISEKIHHLLNLPLPLCAPPQKPTLLETHYNSWQELALALYNPIYETQLLKQASDSKSAFLTLRKEHTYRHNFTAYFPQDINNDLNANISLYFK